MLKKYLCIFLTLIMALSTTVGASNYTGYMEPITDPGVQPMNVLCTLFGHDEIEVYTGILASVACINIGDSQCIAKCRVNIQCDRCGEVLEQTTYGHTHYDYCLRREFEANPDTASYCSICHPELFN